MVASEVAISSRRWDDALNNMVTLEFPKGLSLRPILSRLRPNGFEESTVVSLKLKDKLSKTFDPDKILIGSGRIGVSNIHVTFADYIAVICSALDVKVQLKVNEGKWVTIHQPLEKLDTVHKQREWLREISFAGYLAPNLTSYIDANAGRLRFIIEDNKTLGLAALSTIVGNLPAPLSRRSVGGLVANVHNFMTDSFIGCIDFATNSARREPGRPPRYLQTH